MKYMIMVYNSQLDYDAMTGRATPDRPAWSPTDLQAMYGFMESFNAELADSRRTGGHLRADATGTDTAALWAKLDGCTTPPVAGAVGTATTTRSRCDGQVRLYTVTGGGQC